MTKDVSISSITQAMARVLGALCQKLEAETRRTFLTMSQMHLQKNFTCTFWADTAP